MCEGDMMNNPKVKIVFPSRTQIHAVDKAALNVLKSSEYIKIESIKPYTEDNTLYTVSFKYTQSNTNEQGKASNSTETNNF